MSSILHRKGGPAFPRLLERLGRDAPDALEAEGLLASNLGGGAPSVAIVGTREPPDWAMPFTAYLAERLAAAGAVVISGGARGIDTAAHAGALTAEGGRTIAVVAGGIDRLTPSVLLERAAEIRGRGCIVAVSPRGTPSLRHLFFQRNAVIAALASVVVMVSAPFKSGARNTMSYARRFGRPRFVGPFAPHDPRTFGCEAEISMGAVPVDDVGPIASTLGLSVQGESWSEVAADRIARWCASRTVRLPSSHAGRPHGATPAKAHPIRAPAPLPSFGAVLSEAIEREVHLALREGAVGIDGLVLRSAATVASLRALLLTWTVEGIVKERRDGLYELVNG